MKGKTVVGIISKMLLIGMLTLAFKIEPIKAEDDLLLSMEVSETTITIGQSINITLTLTNVGCSNVTIAYTPPLFDVFYCTYEGCFLWSDGMYFIQVMLEFTLEPGENYSETLTWNLYQYKDGKYYPPDPETYSLFGLCYPTCLVTPFPTLVTLIGPKLVDIHPHELNLRSRDEWITAYIELPEDYNINDINASSILMNDAIPFDPSAPITIGDHDDDSFPDLMIKFNKAKVKSHILANVNMKDLIEERLIRVKLTLTGMLNDGTAFKGSDTIEITYMDLSLAKIIRYEIFMRRFLN